MFKKLLLAITLSFSVVSAFAQDDLDLLSLINDSVPHKREKVYATFKTTKIINGQSVETVKKNSLDFRVTHRFSDIATGGSAHSLYGFDNSTDIRISFDYGVT